LAVVDTEILQHLGLMAAAQAPIHICAGFSLLHQVEHMDKSRASQRQ
jgi:hypothetical protein